MALPFPLCPVTVVCGHYGVGKTNFALNLALEAAAEGLDVTLIDLDIVNPYFRSSEYRDVLDRNGVALVAPVFAEAHSNLDVPSLTGAIVPAINRAYFDAAKGEGTQRVIIDVGGDDAGATSLARFARDISSGDYGFLYVVNRFRNLTQSVDEAVAVLREIEQRCGLYATGIVSNAHLKSETTFEVIDEGATFAKEVARETSLELVCVTQPIWLAQQDSGRASSFEWSKKSYSVQMHVRSPWE